MTDKKLMRTEQAAAILNVKPETLVMWRHRRMGPPWVKVERAARYRPEDLENYIRTRIINANEE